MIAVVGSPYKEEPVLAGSLVLSDISDSAFLQNPARQDFLGAIQVTPGPTQQDTREQQRSNREKWLTTANSGAF